MTVITKPRRVVHSADTRPPASVALAVLGDMLTNAEDKEREMAGAGATTVAIQRAIVATLRVARERVAKAEAQR